MARVFFLFALLALASVGAYNKYEGGQNKKNLIKKIPRRDGKIQEVATEVWRNRSNQVNFYSLHSIDNGDVNPFVYDFKIATRDRMWWDILVILAAV